MRYLIVILASLILVGCAADNPNIILSTPLSVTIKTIRNYASSGVGATQEIYDMAQKYCKEKGANAVPTKSWIQSFDGNYFEFECKK